MFFIEKISKNGQKLADRTFSMKYTLFKERNKKEVDKHGCIVGKNR